MCFFCCVVANAEATFISAISSFGGNGCIAPMMSSVVVVMAIAETAVVCCGRVVWFPSARIRSDFTSLFSPRLSLSSYFRRMKVIAPLAVSSTAWWFRIKFKLPIGRKF